MDVKKRLTAIEQRNKKVELDKSWETSWSRKIIIAVLTYATIVLFFFVAQLPKPFVNSIVPTAGFVLSTLSLPFFKKLWINYRVKK
ncbi:hypothetical protein COV11_00360 [Candidatus Woesearchaeota archaeon CG10_big_fil_rev_8_21_14_0_10_30_7]|nr:MAG: hypothetical protein COV11_00360 [Candidatus Woesearchaeota archaeon CG10_big_fil_rev_8_21_14_0_10_30_7]